MKQKRTKIKLLALISLPLLIVAFSLLGGSAIWHVLGLADDLTIEGEASVVNTSPLSVGDGWPAYGGDQGGNRYSTADQITKHNIQQMDVAWTHRTQTFKGRENVADRTAFQATPILAAGSLLFCTPFNEVIALDPGTGQEKWRYDAKVDTSRRPANDFTCRGVAVWEDNSRSAANCSSRVFMGTVDSRLIALDADTGQTCQDFGEQGTVQIEPDLALRWPGEMQISSAPVIIGDVIVTGTSIGDNLRSFAPKGTVYAFDVRSGKPAWQFNPVPHDSDDPARRTWAEGSTDKVGHANVWTSMSVDEQRGLVFLPTSSASPDFYGGARAGDNLYANSVVALNGKTGEVVWHYQTVHHDVWDYDLPSQPGLYQVTRGGQQYDVVALVTKTGFVFVLERDTGLPFLPIEERLVPQNGVAGEVLSATQPMPLITPPIVPNELNASDAFGITYWDKKSCVDKIKSARHDGLFTPPSTQGTLVYPFNGGGANWGSTAYDPRRNLLVVNMSNAIHHIQLYSEISKREQLGEINHDAEFAPMEGVPYSMTRKVLASPLGLPCNPPPWGVIAGVDLNSGRIMWRKTLGTTEDLAPGGLALELGTPNFGGPIISAGGLIFIGAAMDNYLRAFDVETGTEVWKGRLPAGGQATPMTYTWNEQQYVVIAAGGHSKSQTKIGDYLVAFALKE